MSGPDTTGSCSEPARRGIARITCTTNVAGVAHLRDGESQVNG